MSLPTASFVGCGRLGKTLAKLWHDKAVFQIQGLLTRSFQTAEDAVAYIGAGSAIASYQALSPVDWVCIATGDDALPQVVEALSSSGRVRSGTKVIHFSGCLSSDVLAPLRQLGCLVGSVHPALSFAKPELAYQQFPNTYCIIEGDEVLLPELSRVVEVLGGQVVMLEPQNKAIYHAACSFAGNFVYALIDQASALLHQAGFSEQQARDLSVSLLSGVAFNIASAPNEPLLTGPIGRGDVETVRQHTDALLGTPWSESYRVLASSVLQYAPLDSDKKTALSEVLDRMRASDD